MARLLLVFAASIAVCLALPEAAGADPITGELVWEATESRIGADGDWANTDTKIEWSVEKTDPSTWSYTYTLTVSGKDISHFVIETSGDLTEIAGVTSSVGLEENNGVDYTFGVFGPDGPGRSSPGIPAPVYGVKFDLDEDAGSMTVSFTTDRRPVWGDFYAKAGGQENASVAFNAGFTENDTDPEVFGPDSKLVTDHILVPDTVSDPLPEPGTFVLLCLGAVGAIARLRRR